MAAGDVDNALALLVEAFEISNDLDMLPLKEKVIPLQIQADNQSTSAPAYPDGLTHREVEVLQLIARGKSSRDIAGELFISPNTAGHHVIIILSKTGSSNRAELVAYATRRDLLS